jgi:hypothetical protein
MSPIILTPLPPVGLVGHYLSTGKNGVGVDLPLWAEATQIQKVPAQDNANSHDVFRGAGQA